MTEDIRWHQRLSNYGKAFKQLKRAVQLANERQLSDLEEQGLIQAFEFTHELAWKTIKDFIESQGSSKIYGSKDATREAFQLGLIQDGESWMEMIRSRNESSHTYNEKTAAEISNKIIKLYFPLFQSFEEKMEAIRSSKQGSIFDSQ
jgi:nucleotidyltransferase substrate binding protein (TIGR01987 family)